ncbi:MAG: DUF262 domain-containing protein [Candidatus Glassbacteria bacterium]|nr:DUF262 domain-containing protein [Candidatus Glassbacteria bacterium]
MNPPKYSVNQYLIEMILAAIKSGEIAIPEIQRPFLWDASKVRDLMDSLYQGYPIGYLIAWRNPNVRLKDGRTAEGKKILIDGQQRVTALKAAVVGDQVVNRDYRKVRIQIAFHPIKETFEVFNPAIGKDSAWIQDIAPVISGNEGIFALVKKYCLNNPDADEEQIGAVLEKLRQITQKQLGLIELHPDLDIETVTEIFIRINSAGVVLSQADFAMSKIASNERYGGPTLRKCIDYFCHLAVAPEFYSTLVETDRNFTETDYFKKMSWLKNENDDLYDPDYNDLLRVAFTSEFNRGRLADLVSLLSGRNFETRTYEDEIARESFAKLEKGILNFMNEIKFRCFLMILNSAGFISSSLIRSQNSLNFAYILYLKLKSQEYSAGDIERYVRRWFVFSILTGRYSGSPEATFDFDIKQISERSIKEYMDNMERAELSEAFWDFALIQSLNTSVSSSPYFNVYLAAQAKQNDKGFASKDITVKDLITFRGDIHHIFPREYLKSFGMTRSRYNQVANYVMMQSEINIQIGRKAPDVYFNELRDQCNGGKKKYGNINDYSELLENMRMNCVPEAVFGMNADRYEEFLELRRALIARKIKDYYFSL